ncbi:LLM class flavin-dependent oxidoreductase [Streptomyces sp. NBC_01340]|uniref:LLM class flavin-dependent oxidoreductase n=1 Tax=unclassified Streptomyces TaxID=2593676 RepID=UPI002256ECFF|nr:MULTISPECIES: LLM class flavin-dependent oxidoreductase [unclassified Streptomyces]MCX4458239.1 LLM class flavin-dependent oxidoreductase [Streptomyces sp. NBC_01719]MCX4497596.1 LLM class flavin-dependent oxidoreductase [Streptomyces sp. NBC_01728]WSI42422.1 LLM class flavin-dependent oxidoreductase [Streptomyces sp. NBC_01340]
MSARRTPLRVGVRVPPCDRADHLVETVRRAERLGFDDVWFPDSQLLWRDVFTTLTAAALGTERIGLGTAVTNLATRHPAVVASAARSVAELAPGRFTLGLGVGNSSVGPIGLRQTTSAAMREGLGMLRALLDGEEWDFDGHEGKVRSRLRDPRPEVPLHLAASGPKNLRLAGEIADGVILLSGVSPRTLQGATARVREGAEVAGRDADRVPLTVSAFCAVTDDVEAEARRIKPICASIAQNGGAPFLALAGIDVQVPAAVPGVYPDLVHAEDWDAAVEICSAWISDETALRFAEEFCLFGTAERIAERLSALHALGVTGVFLQHVGSYDPPTQLIEAVGSSVLPALSLPTEAKAGH